MSSPGLVRLLNMNTQNKERILNLKAYERLLQYAAFDTTSDENAPEDVCPRTEKQKKLAEFLVEE